MVTVSPVLFSNPLPRPSLVPLLSNHHTYHLHRHAPPPSATSTTVAPPQQVEVFKSLEGWANQHMLPMLKPVDKCWQPQELLPDPTQPSDVFIEQVRALRERTAELPDDYLVVLVGDLITEDAIPTYQSTLNSWDQIRDLSGSDPNPWAAWTRAWSAEENRHGDLLRTYLYLSGRVDMVMVERTVQYLIRAGWNSETDNNAYMGYIYTSFQERATAISHCNTAKLAHVEGDPTLAHICGTIAADEKRHEAAYQRVVAKLLEVDPNDTMLAIATMARRRFIMPARLMHDGQDPELYEHFEAVAQRLGVYTAKDYADIMDHLVGRWGLEKMEGLKADGREAQEFVCGFAHRIRKVQERAEDRAKDKEKIKVNRGRFSWIFNREIHL